MIIHHLANNVVAVAVAVAVAIRAAATGAIGTQTRIIALLTADSSSLVMLLLSLLPSMWSKIEFLLL